MSVFAARSCYVDTRADRASEADRIYFEQHPFELTENLLDRAFESCFVNAGMED